MKIKDIEQKLSLEKFLARVETAKKSGGVDLSTAEDLSLAVMNLISLEEHFFFTAMKTKKDEYFRTAEEVRSLRKNLLARLMPRHEGESWCVSKHLLAATMRLIEVGNKMQSEGKKGEAKDMFEKAYKTYAIFWALKLKLIEAQKITKVPQRGSGLEDLVAQLADCCKE